MRPAGLPFEQGRAFFIINCAAKNFSAEKFGTYRNYSYLCNAIEWKHS